MSEDKVPVFKKWSHWYALVIGFLALLIILFYLFTKYFS
jgi:glucose uptake protein GlcU